MVPDAEQRISAAAPGFKIDGKAIAGFAAFKNHLSYLPHSGSVFPELADECPIDQNRLADGAGRCMGQVIGARSCSVRPLMPWRD